MPFEYDDVTHAANVCELMISESQLFVYMILIYTCDDTEFRKLPNSHTLRNVYFMISDNYSRWTPTWYLFGKCHQRGGCMM